MTPAARFAAAIEILDAWRGGLAAEQALTRWARGARFAGSKDRAAIRDHVYDVLRCKGRCAALGGGETGRALVLGLARLQRLDLDEIFTGVGHAPPPLSDAEQAISDVADAAADFPSWCLPLVSDRDPTPTLLDALTERAPVWLRVATRNASRDEAKESLAQDGISTGTHADVPTALCITENPRRFRQARAYEKGWVELQDLSAQWAVARVDWPANGRILDYCAGGGGKSLAIADRTEAEIFAHDIAPKRMSDLPLRAERAGVRISTLDEPNGQAPYDAVLLDVPCSGSGTWRRDPDAKWRLTEARLTELTEIQSEILNVGADLVAPGGQLIYMTCSLFRAENEDRVARFVKQHPGWQVRLSHCDTPLTASDGFFVAVLTKS